MFHELVLLDTAVYQAIEATPTPLIDAPLRRLSNSANHAKLYMAISALLFAVGGKKGRRAAVTGMAAVGLNSFVVNIPMKFAGHRPRPERGVVRFEEARHVKMPTSTSFPSGHSASGFAFAAGVAEAIPALGTPLRGLATVVAYSRVHSGVHYPGDVLVGSLVGMAVGEGTALGSRACAGVCPAAARTPKPEGTGAGERARRPPRVPRAGQASGPDLRCATRMYTLIRNTHAGNTSTTQIA